jgi:hypothetical protein
VVEEGDERQRAQRWGERCNATTDGGGRVRGRGRRRRVKGDGGAMGGGKRCDRGTVGAMGDRRVAVAEATVAKNIHSSWQK